MKKARSQALATKKKTRSLTTSRVSKLKKGKQVKKAKTQRKTTVRGKDVESQRELWKKQRRDYWKRRFRRLVAN
ncbi:MAG: hypothetical protein GTN53_42095 [Candidatus Aminicenantes bacterium]|nr:hypothetical protein [Candidatus Aminicenantes bacterium]